METLNATKTWKQKTKSVGLALTVGATVAFASIGGSAAPAAAHQFCDAETEFAYDDEGEIRQVTTLYTNLSELGTAEEAVDGLCQTRPVVGCQNDAGEFIYVYGNWTNGNSSVQAAQCPKSFPTIGSAGHQTAYDGQIFPA